MVAVRTPDSSISHLKLRAMKSIDVYVLVDMSGGEHSGKAKASGAVRVGIRGYPVTLSVASAALCESGSAT